MKKYREYMDGVSASDTLHQRLLGLDGSQKRPVQWKKYGALAAALLLVGGLGAWGMAHGGWNALAAGFRPAATTVPETADEPVPDIALVEPGEAAEPGKKTLGGYEVTDGVMATYYILPYIDYGDTDGVYKVSQIAADWDIPAGAVKRELSQDEIAALMGGEDVLSTHLDWDGYTLTGWAAWYEDGSFWGVYVYGGYPGTGPAPVERFEFAVTADQLPPTCLADPSRVEQEIRGLTVSAYGHDGEAACTRRVSFMKDDYGYRFDLTGTDTGLAEERVSRLVRQVADQGLNLSGISPDGAKPVEADPNYSVGEPNWNDSGEGEIPEFVPDYDPAYEDGMPAQDGTPVIEICPNCGAAYPAGSEHDCAATYTCEVCGQTCRMGQAHSHEICGYPLAPDTRICETCGETIPAGMNHDCAMCDGYPAPRVCEICGESYTAGAAHTCRQGGHHQEQHHGGHH